MRVFRIRGLVWPFLFAAVLLVVWLSSSAGVVGEVSAEPMAQTTPIPTITNRQIISVAFDSDDSGMYYTNCNHYELPDMRANEIYIGYCGADRQPIVSGLRFNTSTLSDISFDDITDIYLVLAVEKNEYTNNLDPISIRGHLTTNSSTFTNGSYPLDRSPLTNISAIWTMTPWDGSLPNSPYNSGFSRVQTPSLLPIVQEMHTEIDWELGDPLTFIFQPTGSTPSTNIHRRFIARERLGNGYPTNAHARLVVEYNAPQPITVSSYITSLEDASLQQEACNAVETLKTANPNSAVLFLHFGQPLIRDGQHVIYLFDHFSLVPYDKIGNATIVFAEKLLECARIENVRTNVIVVMSLQNFGSSDNINAETGSLWRQETNRTQRVWRDLILRMPSYRQIHIWGGANIETAWNDPISTIAWLNNAHQIGVPFGVNAAINGCPDTYDNIENHLAQCFDQRIRHGEPITYYWSRSDVISITYPPLLAEIITVPQIYTPRHANQWYYLAYKIEHPLTYPRPFFRIIMTQSIACQQYYDPSCANNYTPYGAWNAISNLLEQENPPEPDVDLIQRISLRHITDMRWMD